MRTGGLRSKLDTDSLGRINRDVRKGSVCVDPGSTLSWKGCLELELAKSKEAFEHCDVELDSHRLSLTLTETEGRGHSWSMCCNVNGGQKVGINSDPDGLDDEILGLSSDFITHVFLFHE